jgi:LysM repeat protein
MQHDNSDDPWGFWQEEPTRHLQRTQVGTRTHGDTAMVPVVPIVRKARSASASASTARMTRPHAHVNPFAARLGWLLAGMAVVVPVAISMRASDRHTLRPDVAQAAEPLLVAKMPPPPTDATLAPDTQPPTTIATTLAAPVTQAAPVTPAPTEAVVDTPAPTDPPTTVVKKKKVVAKPTTTQAAPPPAAAVQIVSKAACTLTYTVAKGDAWSTIAARAKVTMKVLLAANGATTSTLLLPGQTICLPNGASDPGPPATKPPATKPPATTAPATTQPKAAAPATTQPKAAATTTPKAATTTAPPASTVPATTQPAPPANIYSRDQVAQIIRDVWPDDLEDQAISIATRESNLIPTVKNYCCYGLFQIYYTQHQSWLASIGVTSAAQLYDPRVNATAALALYNRAGGWTPWA